MMMCVDTLIRVKQLAKEIRVNSSLSSSRKMTLRQSSQSGERMSQIHSPLRANQTALKFKHNTLAELQEEMRLDFKTETQKQSEKYINKQKPRSRKESLESSMRLTGNKEFQTVNRHRVPATHESVISTIEPLESPDMKNSTVPLRFRAVREVFDEKSFTHKLNETEQILDKMEAQKSVETANFVQERIVDSTQAMTFEQSSTMNKDLAVFSYTAPAQLTKADILI